MKKYGKYEKRPEEVPAKPPRVKNMLLQTYFTSLLCLVLCVTMFFGTSYAWFTSEASNAANEIYVGTLKVGLYKDSTKDGTAQSVNLSGSSTKLFDGSIRWEPGYTALETITVKNEGDLAFEYVLYFTDGSLANGSKMSIADVAKYFDVWVYNHRTNGQQGPNPGSYAAITAENSGWVRAGTSEQSTLANLLDGESVLTGTMITVRDSGKTPANPGTTDGVATADTYTIALHMKEDADAAIMGQKISLSVKLIAYQLASESDGFVGENKYDSGVTVVSDAKSLQNAWKNYDKVQLLNDVTIASEELTMNGGTLYGNGKTIAGNGIVMKTTGGTIKNLTIDGNITVSGATNFTDCTFTNSLKSENTATLENCTFRGEDLDLSALKNGETITLINCVYNNKSIPKAVLGFDGLNYTITEGTELIQISGTKVILTNEAE